MTDNPIHNLKADDLGRFVLDLETPAEKTVGRMFGCFTKIAAVIAFLLFFFLTPLPTVSGQVATAAFVLRFVDTATDRPVPLVEIETFNAMRFVSDNLGRIAIQEPDLVGARLRFVIRGNGYCYPHLDFFEERAVNTMVEPGGQLLIKLKRNVAAERLYRITGAGRYRDSSLAGIPNLDNSLPGRVIGLDSVIPVWWRNQLFCFWGDTLTTDRLNLSASGGIIDLADGGDPTVPVQVNYFADKEGYAQPMIDTGSPGFVWIETVLPLQYGRHGEILAARYVRHKTLEEAVETGFAVFKPSVRKFSVIRRIESSRHHKSAHAIAVTHGVRARFAVQPWEITEPDLKNFMNPSSYINYTCLAQVCGTGDIQIAGQSYRVQRNRAGRPVFAWVRGGVPCSPAVQKKLHQAGLLQNDENWLQLTEVGSGRKNTDFSGSISWNSFRKQWVMITQGHTGEIWYAEADTFTGPWLYARRVVEHDSYNFYNPVHHPWFDRDGGKTLFFEGTYTSFFSRDGYKSPRADYNQVMYRLALDQPSLLLPKPIYRVETTPGKWRLMNGQAVAAANLWPAVQQIEFCAFGENASASEMLQPVYDHAAKDNDTTVLSLIDNGSQPLFYALHTASDAASLDISTNLLKVADFGAVFPAPGVLTLSPEIKPR